MAESFLKKLASTLTRFMLRCTCLGWRVASTPKTSTSPLSGRTSVEITRTSVLFPLPLGPRMPTTSPFPTESETESRARTISPRRFLKLFSTPLSPNAFITTPPVETSPGGRPLYRRPLASNLSQTTRQVSSLSVATANSKSLRATLALREGFPGDRAYFPRSAILSARSCSRTARSCANTYCQSLNVSVSPSLVSSAHPGRADTVRVGIGARDFRQLSEQSSRPPVRSVRGPLLRSVVELEAHVLIATSRTSGRTSPPNTGIPMFALRMCINPSVLCATTTSLELYSATQNLSTTSLNFS